MSSVNTLIKWPGGKAREIKYIEHLIPEYDRYIEPFFGGGAMFFYLNPKAAIINDISTDLIDFYTLVKKQSEELKRYLLDYCVLFDDILDYCDNAYDNLFSIYEGIRDQHDNHEEDVAQYVDRLFDSLTTSVTADLVKNISDYKKVLLSSAIDKMQRTVKNEQKAPFSAVDLKENLITGFTSGTYMYFRGVYNDILLNRIGTVSKEYRIANFYFIREYCYGSMFRYNSKGEFNIPYGGMSYNRKDFRAKVSGIFSQNTERMLSKAEIHCKDFGDFFSSVELNEKDFMFLDPPYDTAFSDYEGKNFTQKDQQRLASALKKTRAQFILIIKNTDFIYSLYEKDFYILCFAKAYTYNVRSRNERNVEHLIVTNIPVV